jgi:hypothetical protein
VDVGQGQTKTEGRWNSLGVMAWPQWVLGHSLLGAMDLISGDLGMIGW